MTKGVDLIVHGAGQLLTLAGEGPRCGRAMSELGMVTDGAVAVADGRTIGRDGRCKQPVGNTVDVKSATYLNNIGDAELRATWTDPDFNPKHRAVYYARVLEIPTPTWQAYDAHFYGVKMPKQVPLSHQERTYTSPIWYTPGG